MIRQSNASPELSYIGPRGSNGKGIAPFVFAMDALADVLPDLYQLGIQGFDDADNLAAWAVAGRRMGYAMDATPTAPLTTASVLTPIQFLQNWLPGFISVITQARKIDELIGVATVGAWEDEEIVQGIKEPLAKSQLYSDLGNVPLSGYNATWERRTIVRIEQGMRSGILDAARASRIKINDAEEKRGSAALQLEIDRNTIGFYGYNSGLNRTYGFLNDPNLPAAGQFPAGTSGSRAWSGKTFQEICADIRLMISTERSQSGATIDPQKTAITLAVPSDQVDYLSTTATNGSGQSVSEWLRQAYSKVRVVDAPELTNAVGGASVAVMYAESVDDTASTDDKRVWLHAVPTRFRVLGVQQMVKGLEEDYTMASAGAYLKRPYAVVRKLFA
jgi:hypothetical protein